MTLMRHAAVVLGLTGAACSKSGETDLRPAGNGTYHGKGQAMMAGNWDVTVMAMRAGQDLGTKKLTLTAK